MNTTLKINDMEIKPIKTEEDYNYALRRVDEIWEEAKTNQDASDELLVLSTLIEVYEDEYYHIPPPNPIEAIKFRMEQQGMTQHDLSKILGFPSRASEILNLKRPLNLNMIRILKNKLNISADLLINDYELER